MQDEKSRKKTQKIWKIIVGAGTSTFVICFVFIFVYKYLFDALVALNLVVKDGSMTYDLWKDPPVDILLESYFYNVTNPEEVQNGGKPIVKQCGPYIYQEFRTKVNISFIHDGDQVFFQFMKHWKYREDLSCCPEDDLITSINVVLIGTAYVLRNTLPKAILPIAFKVINEVAKNNSLPAFTTVPVKQLMFEGYQDPIIDFGMKFPPFISDIFPIPYDKFGWFYPRNGSSWYEGNYTMFTGKDSIDRLGELVAWKGADTTTAYDMPCAMLNGSAGELFPPRPDRTYLDMFLVDLCRSVRMQYHFDSEFRDIPTYRFVLDETVLDNSKENKCFRNTLASGVANVNECQFGAPAWVSYPHFLHANPKFRDEVEGMNPIKEEHESYFEVEPTTGTPIFTKAAFQVNILLEPYDGIDVFSNFKEVLLPTMWFRSGSDIGEDLAGDMKMMNRAEKLTYMFCVLTLVGLVMIVVGSVFLWQNRKLHKRYPLQSQASTDPLCGSDDDSLSTS